MPLRIEEVAIIFQLLPRSLLVTIQSVDFLVVAKLISQKNIDWTCFAAEIASKLPEMSGLSFEEKFESLRDTIISSTELAQTKELPSEKQAWSYSSTNPWWDEEVGVAYRAMIQAERNFRRIGTAEAYDQLMNEQKASDRLRFSKKQQPWREHCEKFDEHTPISELFRAAKRFRNRETSSDPTMTDETLHLFAKRLAPDSPTALSC